MRAYVSVLAAMALGIAADDAGAASNQIGKAASIINSVTGKVSGQRLRRLSTRDPVFQNEVIRTRAGSIGQFVFLDNTKLAIGPSSRLALNRFVYDGNRSAKKVTIRALKGAFRFISGSSARSAYSISTPVATMGIRGTKFDMYIRPNGETLVLLLQGAVRVCKRSGQCQVLRRPCEVVRVPRSGAPRRPRALSNTQLRGLPVSVAFPFLRGQSRLDRRFRASTRSCSSAPQRTNRRASAAPAAPASEIAAIGVTPGVPGDPPAGVPNNPGNDRAVGNAGESPGNGDFGGGNVGRGDTGNGNSGGGNNGGGDGSDGNGNGNGNGGNGAGGNGNGNGGNGNGGNGNGNGNGGNGGGNGNGRGG